jgi:hypothetical protein
MTTDTPSPLPAELIEPTPEQLALARKIADECFPPEMVGLSCRQNSLNYAAFNVALATLSTPSLTAMREALVVENTDGEFVASFATKLLADFFVEEGSGCYRHRAVLSPKKEDGQ